MPREMIECAIVEPIEITCGEARCNCKRIVLARRRGGRYEADEERRCAVCEHANRRHQVLGRALSVAEKRRRGLL